MSDTLEQAHPGILAAAIPSDEAAGRDRLARLAARYRARHPEVPVVEHLDARILRAVERGEGKLRMTYWHDWNDACGTTHCRAGWAIQLAGEAGQALQARLGPRIAGSMIYRASAGRVPDFFGFNQDAFADLRQCAQIDPIEAPSKEG